MKTTVNSSKFCSSNFICRPFVKILSHQTFVPCGSLYRWISERFLQAPPISWIQCVGGGGWTRRGGVGSRADGELKVGYTIHWNKSSNCVLVEVQKGRQCTRQTETVTGSNLAPSIALLLVCPSGTVHPIVQYYEFTRPYSHVYDIMMLGKADPAIGPVIVEFS